jgi:hypothetical protein
MGCRRLSFFKCCTLLGNMGTVNSHIGLMNLAVASSAILLVYCARIGPLLFFSAVKNF